MAWPVGLTVDADGVDTTGLWMGIDPHGDGWIRGVVRCGKAWKLI
jgi:hypothetical protein